MKKVNKWLYLYIIQGHYGDYGWEDVNTEETLKDARRSLREYNENEPQYPHRRIRRRELNLEWRDPSLSA